MSEYTETAKTAGRSMTAFGVISIILGIMAMLMPVITGLSIALFLGIIVLAAGIMRIFWAVKAGAFGKGFPGVVIGLLTLICGGLMIANPVFISGVLSIVLAIYFIFDGIFEIVAAFQRKPVKGWGWLMFGGIVSLLLGMMIWAQYPLSGAWAMGILIGIKLFMIGLIMVTCGSAVRELTNG